MRRWLVRALGAGLLIVSASGLAAFAWLWSSLPQTAGTIRLASPGSAVEIIRDAHGVPHIFAGDEFDAVYALGFVHAQDRLFQMDMMRLSAQGRLSEAIGPATVDLDRFMRALDLTAQADATLTVLEPRWRRLLGSYAAGVNAFLDTRSGALPPEFLITGRTPEPWTPRDSVLWGKLMALQLAGNWRDELLRARLSARLSPAMMRELWPEWPADAATTLTSLTSLYRALDLDNLAQSLPPPLGPALASNEWVLAGTRTRSGKPILANDPHLSLAAPGTWYLARIEAPGLELAGATAPGVPAVVLGHNGAIAWGFTTTTADQHDLFVERVDPDDPSRYLAPDGPRPFATRTETIKVKGEADVTVTVRGTRHGVVISDLNRAAAAAATPGHVLALSVPGFHVPDRTPAALFALNRATDWTAFTAALRDWHAPMQNIVYADSEGHIGFYSPALLPRRKAGQGWLPQPGWTDAFDWDGFVPFDELPHAIDPPSGRIVNANNRVVPDGFPVFVSRDWDAPYRARRIGAVLDATDRHDVASTAALLKDGVSLFAREILPQLASLAVSDPRARQAIALLRNWDGAVLRERPEPLIFNAWMRELIRGLIADELDERFQDAYQQQPALIRAALAGDSAFCDDVRTPEREGCTAAIEAALGRALDALTAAHGNDMTRWRWGAAHVAPFRHALFSRVPVLEGLLSFDIATDGDFFTVNRGASRIGDPTAPFAHVHGPGLRAIYDLADLGASRFIAPPGQSGHPLSRHWGDMARPWADGETISLGADRTTLRSAGSALILAPRDRR